MTADPLILHATTVSIAQRGVMIVGPSGAGKSGLALQLITLGATLVADDRTIVTRCSDDLIVSCPESIAGLIEAREVGLIGVSQAGPTPLHLVVDLSRVETARLPQEHKYAIAGLTRPCLYKSAAPYFPAAISLYIQDRKRFPHDQ